MDDKEFIWSWENMQRRISNCRDADIIVLVWDGQRGEDKKKPSATEGVKKTADLHDVFGYSKEIKWASNVHESALNEPSRRRIEDEMYVVNKSPYS